MCLVQGVDKRVVHIDCGRHPSKKQEWSMIDTTTGPVTHASWWVKGLFKRLHTVVFCFWHSEKGTTLVTEARPVDARVCGGDRGWLWSGTRWNLRVMEVFCSSIVVAVMWPYVLVRAHRPVHEKGVDFYCMSSKLTHSIYLNKNKQKSLVNRCKG